MGVNDTILAIATARGRAGVAIIRVSGQEARFVFETITGALAVPRSAHLHRLRDPGSGETIDQAVTLFFAGPASFTGEDVAEFHIHGSPAVSARLLSVLLGIRPGIRLAEPGEFTRRAFENGRMNLVEVEALADLIDSETEWQRRQAMAQLSGGLGKAAASWRDMLIEASAHIEADLDFSDEADVSSRVVDRASEISRRVAGEIEAALVSARSGERVRDGFTVVILGPPNVGKSSLINCIAGRDVAIVSEQAGTTRDLIEIACDIDGMPVVFVDTAGIRDTGDDVEREGMRRALDRSRHADCVLLLSSHDTAAVSGAELGIPDRVPVISVATKCDDGGSATGAAVPVSTLDGRGLDELLQAVSAELGRVVGVEPALVTRQRHAQALMSAAGALSRAARGGAAELVAEDVRVAIRDLERLIGRVDVEDVLDRIFSSFCIGK